MPDPNKFKRLRQIGYTIPSTCGFCVHGMFGPGAHFGTCAVHEYEHGKHTGPPRQLSIYLGGRCSVFEQDLSKTGVLGAFAEFFEGESP